MNTKKQNLPIAAKVLLTLLLGMVILSGCNNSFDALKGKVYLYKDSVYEFTAAFEGDTIFYIMKDERMPMFHKSLFESEQVNDSTYLITLKDQPKFWDKNTWEIVVIDDKKFRSKESGNYYNLYSDTMIVRLAPEFQKPIK